MKIDITYAEAKQILSSLHETENTLFGFTSSWRINAKIEMIDGIKKKIYEQMKSPAAGEKKMKKEIPEKSGIFLIYKAPHLIFFSRHRQDREASF